MKTLRDLQLLSIVDSLPPYKVAESLYGMEIALFMFDMICSSHKNIAFQSAAMQIGLRTNNRGMKAFEKGAAIIINCKDIGLYMLKSNEKTMWLRPALQFDDDETFLLDPINFEFHEKPDLVESNDNILLSKFSQHHKNLNYDFLNKINQVPFVIDTDILLNFAGENMPITYSRVTSDYLGKPVYFEWKYDSRGRSYSTGYALNVQGNKTVRSILSLQNEEVIKDIEPIYIAMANARGFDGWTWERRIKWAKKQPIDHHFTIPKGTKYPERYAKAIRAAIDHKEGIPSGYIMELDATASGIQIMGAITGCMKTGKEVNLVDPKRRRDVYRSMAREMSKQVEHTITREECKYPGMTHYYNSLATPKEVFNPEELKAFYSCLDGKLPGAEFCMKRLNRCWNPAAKSHSWTLPDGHVAFVRTMTSKDAKYSYGDVTVDYQYYVNEGNKSSYRSLVPNIIHSIDGYVVRQMILRATFELVHVHDCFLFHPNHFEEVKYLYRKILSELVTDYNINHIIQSLTGDWPNIEIDTRLKDAILKSEYALS